MSVTVAPVQWKRPRPDFYVSGTDWGAPGEVLVSKKVEEDLYLELWFVPGHKGWGDRLEPSAYYPAVLVLTFTRGDTSKRTFGLPSDTQIASGGRLQQMLQRPRTAKAIKEAFGPILDSIGRRTTLLIDHEGIQDGRELED